MGAAAVVLCLTAAVSAGAKEPLLLRGTDAEIERVAFRSSVISFILIESDATADSEAAAALEAAAERYRDAIASNDAVFLRTSPDLAPVRTQPYLTTDHGPGAGGVYHSDSEDEDNADVEASGSAGYFLPRLVTLPYRAKHKWRALDLGLVAGTERDAVGSAVLGFVRSEMNTAQQRKWKDLGVAKLTERDFRVELAEAGVHCFALIASHTCEGCEAALKELNRVGTSLRDRAHVVVGSATPEAAASVAGPLDIRTLPAAIWRPAGGEWWRYDGPLDVDSIEDYIRDAAGMAPRGGAVTQLSGRRLLELAARGKDGAASDLPAVFAKLYTPGCWHCKQLAPVWAELAAKFRDRQSEVLITETDVTRYDGVGGLLDGGVPTLLWFPAGGGRREGYRGSRSLEALARYVQRNL
eukprot:TRINITY_DN27725_c0_g1_i2.p1 TRINITY_DN27725_c0_g1~~TRINITY_DN27725_c0_g1_i2.p1  ORF type:complete len:411 (+),score=112.35 TRINITY_DN27725_c0_g1_i2:71-1303(+)